MPCCPCCPVALLPCCPVALLTLLPCCAVTLLPLLPCCLVALFALLPMLPFYSVTLLLCRFVTLLPCYPVALVTLLPCCPVAPVALVTLLPCCPVAAVAFLSCCLVAPVALVILLRCCRCCRCCLVAPVALLPCCLVAIVALLPKRTEIERFNWFIERIQPRVAFGWLSERVKKSHARELSRNQPILRFDFILQHDWPIEQCLLHIRAFFSGKRKKPCFDLAIHWLIKQITNTYRNHFSRSYENHPILKNKTGPLFLELNLCEERF